MVLVTVERDQIKSMWDLAPALDQYRNKNPLESGKPADTVFENLLFGSDFLTMSPVGKLEMVPVIQEQSLRQEFSSAGNAGTTSRRRYDLRRCGRTSG